MRALIAVYDKTDLTYIAKELHDLGFELLATGGTANAAIKLLIKTKTNIIAFLCLIELTNLKGRNNIEIETNSLLSFDE